jgi:cytochrome subunit of sulfide dehydrogenase
MHKLGPIFAMPLPRRRAGSRVAALALCGALVAVQAHAAEVAPAVLAAGCSACHGPAGQSPGAIPSIKGADAGALRAVMLAYKKDEIQGTVMNRIAKGFSDGEIEALTAFLKSRQ